MTTKNDSIAASIDIGKALEATARAARPLAEAMHAIEHNSAIRQMLESVKHHDAKMRAMLGPVEELQRARAFAVDSSWWRDIDVQRQAMAGFRQSDTAATLRAIGENSGIRKVLESIKQHDATMRAAMGPIEELRRAGAFDVDSSWRREMDLARQAMVGFEARYRLPEMTEATRLINEFRTSSVSDALARYAEQTSSLQYAMERVRTPWLDARDSMRSVAGFAELQGIGHALGCKPAFGEDLSAALRIDLGDWRDPIAWRPEIFTDLTARADFYESLGFDHALTDFPAPAFVQSLDIAGLRHEPPPLVALYGPPVPRAEDDEKEEGLARTNMAHDWLLRLETTLREFIDEQMTKTFGDDWPKRRLPNGLYEKWQEKKRKAKESGGQEWPLIAYADFTDYELVICRGDNWREIFAAFFGRTEGVRESFQRLYPIRLDTMHARPIAQDDELLLYVETRRLVKVIKAKC